MLNIENTRITPNIIELNVSGRKPNIPLRFITSRARDKIYKGTDNFKYPEIFCIALANCHKLYNFICVRAQRYKFIAQIAAVLVTVLSLLLLFCINVEQFIAEDHKVSKESSNPLLMILNMLLKLQNSCEFGF